MDINEIFFELDKQGISYYDFGYCNFGELKNVGAWEEVTRFGGVGKGDTWFSVKYFKDHNIYIKTIGFYSSYHLTEFDSYGEEVKPIERTLTFYE